MIMSSHQSFISNMLLNEKLPCKPNPGLQPAGQTLLLGKKRW